MATGIFHDGKTARRHPVSVSTSETGLIITGDGEHQLARWTLGTLTATEGADGLRISDPANPDAILILDEGPGADNIRSFLPRKPNRRLGFGLMPLGLFSMVAAAFLIGFVTIHFLPQLARPLAVLAPLEWEQSVGAAVMDTIPGANRVCGHEKGRHALDRLTATLGDVMELPYPVRVNVSRLTSENAFAVPGGSIVIGNRLIRKMESPDELAAVLAHEMAHVAERHPATRAIQVFGITLILQLISGGGSELGELLADGAGMLLLLSYSRDDERRADALALRALSDTGIDAGGFAVLLKRMEKKSRESANGGSDSVFSWLSTHPSFKERRQMATATEHRNKPALSDEDWAALKSICGG